VFILKGVKVICFDTLLQVFILKYIEGWSGSARERDDGTGVETNDNAETRRVRRRCGGMPPPVFCKRVRKLLKTNDRGAKKSAKRKKESARVCAERV
jgi:hypothetical protein